MKYTFIETINEQEHDYFVKHHKLCNLLQSSNWAKIKSNWKHVIVGVKQEQELLASAMILIRPLPLGWSMFYIPRGPIMDYQNQELVSFFMQNLKKFARKRKALFVTFDPSLMRCDHKLEEEYKENKEVYDIIQHLQQLNINFKGFTTNLSDTIQPRFHANVYYKEDYEEEFTKACKKALQQAKKKQVQVEYGHLEFVEEFAKVMQCTESRKQIQLRDQSYYKRLLEVYKDDACIVLCSLPLKKLLEDITIAYDNVIQQLEDCPPNAKKKRFTLEEQKASYTRDKKELSQLVQIHGDRVVIAGALCVCYGKTSEILYAGMDETFKRYMAPYVSFSSCMKWCFEKGCIWCNMGGVENDLKGGLMKFKANFNPNINEFVGEFDLVVYPSLYKLSQWAYQIRKKQRK